MQTKEHMSGRRRSTRRSTRRWRSTSVDESTWLAENGDVINNYESASFRLLGTVGHGFNGSGLASFSCERQTGLLLLLLRPRRIRFCDRSDEILERALNCRLKSVPCCKRRSVLCRRYSLYLPCSFSSWLSLPLWTTTTTPSKNKKKTPNRWSVQLCLDSFLFFSFRLSSSSSSLLLNCNSDVPLGEGRLNRYDKEQRRFLLLGQRQRTQQSVEFINTKNLKTKKNDQTIRWWSPNQKVETVLSLTSTIWSLIWILPETSATLPGLTLLTKMPESSSARRDKKQNKNFLI